MQKSNLAHVGLFGTRGCTCEKGNLIEAKRWVTLRYEFLSKKVTKKTQQKGIANKSTNKNSILQFYSLWSPPKSWLPCGSGDDFRDFAVTPARGCSGLFCDPKEAQDSPKTAQESPREPKRVPRGSQRPPRESQESPKRVPRDPEKSVLLR